MSLFHWWRSLIDDLNKIPTSDYDAQIRRLEKEIAELKWLKKHCKA